MAAADHADSLFRRLLAEAHNRWLKPSEVLVLLQNVKQDGLSQKTFMMPHSGSVIFYNKRVNRYFRQDGYAWRKKKESKTVAEAHEKLKVGNSDALNCYYARGEFDPNFQRRSYWMLNSDREHIVLVHYLEVSEGVHSFGSLSVDSGSDNKTDLISGSEGSEKCVHYDNSYSAGSAAEVNSSYYDETSQIDHLQPPSSLEIVASSYLEATCRELEAQLGLEDNNGHPENQTGQQITPSSHLNCEEAEGNSNEFNNSLQVSECNHNFKEDAHLQFNSCSVFGTYAADNSNDPSSSGSLEEKDDTFWKNMLEHADTGRNLPPLLLEGSSDSIVRDENNFAKVVNEDIVSNENDTFPCVIESMGWGYSDLSAYNLAPTGSKFSIREISPNWAYSTESTKVIIAGDFPCSPVEGSWAVMFGETEVPAEIVQQGVLRCWSPQHVPGCIDVCITSGNMEACSEFTGFVYIMKPESAMLPANCLQLERTRSSDEFLLLVNFAQTLLCEYGSAEVKVEECKSGKGQYGETETRQYRLNQLIQDVVSASGSPPWILDQLLEELFRDKLPQWLKWKTQSEGTGLSTKEDYGIIHFLSGLGYEWALKPVLNSGVGVNFRDVKGWTALHWAARFGREKMVAALLAAGAFAGAVTDPTEDNLLGKTPDSIAAEYGHNGLAGYLAEVAVTSHFSSLTVGGTEIPKLATFDEPYAIQGVSEKICSTGFTETEDQLSLKDSWGAVMNATQAAARIQSAFRVHSFRKKLQKNASYCSEYDMTPEEIHEAMSKHYKLHHGARNPKIQLESAAALCIQKKFRGWKGRKNFLKMRQNAVRIQAHVRGHQVRRKYRFSMTVSILEKAILRWRRRGVGLRVSQTASEFENMDVAVEEEEILKIFRKEKVDDTLKVAVSRVLAMVESPEARQQYRRMLECFQRAKAELSDLHTPADDSGDMDGVTGTSTGR